MDLQGIVIGWANLTRKKLNTLPDSIAKEGERRLKICDSCSVRTGNVCDPNKSINIGKTQVRGCGCVLSAKALSPGAKCPAGKW